MRKVVDGHGSWRGRSGGCRSKWARPRSTVPSTRYGRCRCTTPGVLRGCGREGTRVAGRPLYPVPRVIRLKKFPSYMERKQHLHLQVRLTDPTPRVASSALACPERRSAHMDKHGAGPHLPGRPSLLGPSCRPCQTVATILPRHLARGRAGRRSRSDRSVRLRQVHAAPLSQSPRRAHGRTVRFNGRDIRSLDPRELRRRSRAGHADPGCSSRGRWGARIIGSVGGS